MAGMTLRLCSGAGVTRGFAGYGAMAVRVVEDGQPGPYAVRLYDKNSDVCVAHGRSDDGTIRFQRINPDLDYFVVAFDHGVYPKNASLADRYLGVAMEYEDC